MARLILFKKDCGVVRGEGSTYEITNYLTKDTSSRLSVAVSRLRGELGRTLNKVSDRVYYFLEGRVSFTFDEGGFEAKAGDIVYVPAGTAYEMEGNFEAVLISAPPFELSNEVWIDKPM